MSRIYEDHLGETLRRPSLPDAALRDLGVPEEDWGEDASGFPEEAEDAYGGEPYEEEPVPEDTSWTGSLAASIRAGALEAPRNSFAWREARRTVNDTATMPRMDLPTENYSWEQVEAELESQIGYRRSSQRDAEYTRQPLRRDDYGTEELPRGELVSELTGEMDPLPEEAYEWEAPGQEPQTEPADPYEGAVVAELTIPSGKQTVKGTGAKGKHPVKAGQLHGAPVKPVSTSKSGHKSAGKEEELTPQQKAEKRRQKHQMQVHHRILLLIAATLIVIVQIWQIATPDREKSEKENRMLAGKPAFSREGLTAGTYFSGLESWFSDQFPGRDNWIALNLSLNKLLGAHEAGNIYFGTDGYLLARPDAVNYEVVSEKISGINRLHSIYPDLNVVVSVIPEAAHVLKDRLPKNAEVNEFPSAISYISTQLSEGISCPNVYPVLSGHAGEYIYYKTDHHWTSLGGFYVYQSIRELLGIAQERSFKRLPVSTTFQGTLASQTGEHGSSDTVELFIPEDGTADGSGIRYYVNLTDTQTKRDTIYVSEALEQSDHYTVFFGGNYPQVEIRSTNMNGKNLLVFKDSYANSFVQLLVDDFEKIIMIDPRYYYGDIQSLINAEGVTDVLFLYCADTFFTDTTLNDVLNSVEEVMEPEPQETAEETEGTEQTIGEAAEAAENG